MKHKRLIGITLATALVLSLTTTALATGGGVIPGGGGSGAKPSPEEVAANGNTTISIMESKVDPKNVSFTVPLYVTMAVVNGTDAVTVPDNYGITNNSTVDTTGEASATDFKIGVTAMSFEKLEGSSYNTVAYSGAALSDLHSLMLTIGGVDMPVLAAAGVVPVSLTTTSVRPGNAENKFWDATGGGKPKPILPNTTLNLPLSGTVMSTNRSAAAAVPQFKVKYTISLLDQNEKPLGWVYAGDDRTQAGLGAFTPAP